MDRDLLAWLVRYGPPVLFMAQLFGIFGLPIPDELLLTAAGVLMRKGQLHGTPTMAAAIGGCAAGITISYTLGRTVGLPTLQRAMHVRPEALQRAQRWFHRYGRWLLAFGYFIPGVRHVTALAAGSTLDYETFARYAYPGAVLWSSTFVGVGYFAGDHWEALYAMAREHATQVAIAGALAAASYMIWVAASRPGRRAIKRKPRSYRG